MKPRLTGSITVRLGAKALRLVRTRAKAEKKSASDVIRELIEAEWSPREDVSALSLSRAWVGAIRDSRLPRGAAAREGLEDWAPDRR